MTYTIARTASGRPTLQHELDPEYTDLTRCGLDVSNWSRTYQREALLPIICKKCGRDLLPHPKGNR